MQFLPAQLKLLYLFSTYSPIEEDIEFPAGSLSVIFKVPIASKNLGQVKILYAAISSSPGKPLNPHLSSVNPYVFIL